MKVTRNTVYYALTNKDEVSSVQADKLTREFLQPGEKSIPVCYLPCSVFLPKVGKQGNLAC